MAILGEYEAQAKTWATAHLILAAGIAFAAGVLVSAFFL